MLIMCNSGRLETGKYVRLVKVGNEICRYAGRQTAS